MSKGNRRNDSSSVSSALHHNPPENNNMKPKPDDHRRSDSAHSCGCDEGRTNSELTGGSAGNPENPQKLDEEEHPSSCCKLSHLKKLSGCEENLGPLTFDRRHAVLVNVETFSEHRRLIPAKGKQVWDGNHVKMPDAMRNQTAPNQGPKWNQISEHLCVLASQAEVSVNDVVNAILSINPKYQSRWKFDALLSFVKSTPPSENDLNRLFPKIATLALKLPEQFQRAIPLLQRGRSVSITMSQVQIACLLANAFFCTFPHRNTTNPTAEYHTYPSINFSSLFGKTSNRKIQKLKAIIHYFRVVTDEKMHEETDTEASGLVTFERRCLGDADKPCWESCRKRLNNLHVTSKGHIEDEGSDFLQVDFASKAVGGGVLDCGLVQEEILFLLHPELIVSRLFTQELDDNDCLIVTGLRRFSLHVGYSDSFQWAGPYDVALERDEWKRLKRRIVAIDALYFSNPKHQYHMSAIKRELNKGHGAGTVSRLPGDELVARQRSLQDGETACSTS